MCMLESACVCECLRRIGSESVCLQVTKQNTVIMG